MMESGPRLDFPAANGVIEAVQQIEGGYEVRLRPQQHPNTEPWFWWHVGWHATEAHRLRLRFTERFRITSRGGVWTGDDGQTWHEAPPDGPIEDETVAVDLPGPGMYRLALAVPYLREHLLTWLKGHEGHALLRHDVLTRSRGGREVDRLRLGRDDAPYRVSLSCRHHACESMASFVLEGVVDAWLTDPDAAWLREHTAAFIVPIVDADGVAQGEHGKARAPHDHNRDYIQRTYPEVAAIADQLPRWGGQAWRIALDLHCPWIREMWNEHIYLLNGPDPVRNQMQLTLARRLEALDDSGLGYRADQTLNWGEAWNTAPAEQVHTHGRWAGSQPPVGIATTFEIPYRTANGHEVTPARCRRFGRALALAMQQMLRDEAW